ncbi:hypothetical protein MKQ68_10960 [Chitinophaga horti]|uniref:TIGR03790 family protein n=1 Tax=Chitinophaga horti TaxID=2920382 RepID=A0ABY6JBF5_9BACT|nr:hypothetical protein [Chitinophaga horti]UYQ95621.1 hypothetical protein MKQ68_10960 [Chitinophaga horti]
MRKAFLLFICIGAIACNSSRKLAVNVLAKEDQPLADSMLAWALDHEAIYTLLDTIKPISSVKYFQYPVAKRPGVKDGDRVATHPDSLPATAAQYARICRQLSTGDHLFVMMPFKATSGQDRTMEVCVVRRSKFAAAIASHPEFFSQWGFTPATDPATILAVIEYETPHDRNRAYGYFFGYPDYAVDFFVDANRKVEADTSIRRVPRDFFAIPVFAAKTGYFTWAMPKGHQPSAADSAMYKAAMVTLDKYKQERAAYRGPQGMKATALWEKWKRK